MKRKTNLFNLNASEDTLFLTFSNYTEYLTGNFLSTNTKMYPSSFLCFNLPFNDNKTIEDFKAYLMKYYENKLTSLRSWFVKDDFDPEDEVKPLFYLIDAIDTYFKITKTTINEETQEQQEEVEYPEIIYAGDIVEQDYKGTYADSICIINLNAGYKVKKSYEVNSEYETSEHKIEVINENDIENYNEDELKYCIETVDKTILFGWKSEEIESLYGQNNGLTPIYDETENNKYKYLTESNIKKLIFSPYKNDSKDDDIEFNCIIPLFDIKSIITTNTEEVNIIGGKNCTRSNIPLGIWISPEVIKVSKYAGYAQSWSLVVGSKFSPLPYSSINVINDNYFDETTVKDIAYMTYAELLANHADLQGKYNEALQQIYTLNSEIDKLKNQISSLELQSNIEKISDMIDGKFSKLQNDFNSKMKLIEEYIANLKWKYVN